MNIFAVLQIFWIIAVLFNLVIQMAYFRNDGSKGLYLVKKISTPFLLFGGLILLLLTPGKIPVVPAVILAMMGLGEIGIEGSSIVEDRGGRDEPSRVGNLIVTGAGLLFLAVNVLLGTILIAGTPLKYFPAALSLSLAFYFLLNLILARKFILTDKMKFQTRVYSAGLVILLTGVIAGLSGGAGSLGTAGLILAVSDTLVLIRMAGNFDKSSRKGRAVLLVFLVIILLLYYLYMAVLIGMGGGIIW